MTDTMSLAEMKETLPGAGDLFHALIGCEFGHGKVALQTDREACQEQAVRIMVLHGTPAGDVELKLCPKHFDLLCSESTPREESP